MWYHLRHGQTGDPGRGGRADEGGMDLPGCPVDPGIRRRPPGGRLAPNAAFQSVIDGNFAKDAKIVVGCKAGPRSRQAAALLEAAGYSNLVEVRGGFHGERDNFGRVAVAGWAECGLPVETQGPPEKTYAELEKRAAK